MKRFWGKHADAEFTLRAWAKTVAEAEWSCFNEVKQTFRSADVLPGNRVVFNIKGNKYRMVVKIHYNTKFMYVRFIGTHAEYDKIDAETI
ncbi:MAG: type II toxin-antitoxin system HigB family toxin [Kiritimatiellales bacterium]